MNMILENHGPRIPLLPLAQRLLRFLINCLLAGDFTLIVKFPTLRQSQFAFEASILKIHSQRDERQPPFCRPADQPINFGTPQEEFPSA
jgi:hypothetical protein